MANCFTSTGDPLLLVGQPLPQVKTKDANEKLSSRSFPDDDDYEDEYPLALC